MDSKSQPQLLGEPVRFRIRTISVLGCLPTLLLAVLAVAAGAGRPWSSVGLLIWSGVFIAVLVRWARVGVDVFADRLELRYVRNSIRVNLDDLAIEPYPVPARFARARRPAVLIPVLRRRSTGQRIRLPLPVGQVALERAIASTQGTVVSERPEPRLDQFFGATSSPGHRATRLRLALR